MTAHRTSTRLKPREASSGASRSFVARAAKPRRPYKLPVAVYQKGPSLYLVRRNKWHKICRADVSEIEFWREFTKLKEALAEQPTGELNKLFDDFLARGMDDLELSKDTQDLYRFCIKKYLRDFCGNMRINSLTSQHVARLLKTFKAEGKSVTGNRVKACLSSVYSWAISEELAAHNPCLGVKRNREKPRTRYVSDEEFLAGFDRASAPLQDLMAVALLTGLRQKDIRLLRRKAEPGKVSGLTSAGIRVEQSKDGKHVLIRWSDALLFFVKRSIARTGDSPFVFTNTQGKPWTKNSINASLRRLNVSWTFHDLRAKADSDHEFGLGLMARYNRAKRLDPVR